MKKHINWNSWQRGNNIYLYIYIYFFFWWGVGGRIKGLLIKKINKK